MKKKKIKTFILKNRCLILILFFALILRIVFFVGLVGSDPQDDGIYFNNAMQIYRNGIQNFSRYRNIDENYLANPAETFSFRPMVNYPIAFFLKLLGPSEYSGGIYSLLCSIGIMFVVFFFCKIFFNEKVGLLAVFLVSIFPLNVIYSTRILSDMELAFFSSLSFLIFINAINKENKILFLLSGFILGLGYLIKILALLVVPFMIFYILKKYQKEKKINYNFIFFIIGFLIIFLIEGMFYYSQSGNFLLNYHISSTAYKFKYETEVSGSINVGKFLEIRYNTGVPIYHLKNTLFFGEHRNGINLFGFFYFFVLASIIYSILKKKNLLLVLWVLIIFLYLEFGFINLEFHENKLIYFMIFKDPRFLTLITVPSIILMSYFLLEVRSLNKKIFNFLILILFITSLLYIQKDYNIYRNSLNDLRETTNFLIQNNEKIIFGDYLAINNIEIFSKFKLKNLKFLNKDTKIEELNNSYVILGGSRGFDVMTDYVFSISPEFIREFTLNNEKIPNNWVLIKQINENKTPTRRFDLKIYYVK